jgi:hypothetical protein
LKKKGEEEEEPLIAGRYRVIKRAHLEERGVDEGGTPVLIRPPAGGPDGVAFIEREELERTARVVASIESRWLLDPRNGWITGQVVGADGGLATLRGR